MSTRRPAQPNAQSVYREIGARIRQRRIAAGVTLDAVAAHLGVSTVQVQRYEVGTRPIDIPTIVAIAGRIRCSPAEFFNGSAIDGLSKDAIRMARQLDSLGSVGLRHNIKIFVAKLAAYDKEQRA